MVNLQFTNIKTRQDRKIAASFSYNLNDLCRLGTLATPVLVERDNAANHDDNANDRAPDLWMNTTAGAAACALATANIVVVQYVARRHKNCLGCHISLWFERLIVLKSLWIEIVSQVCSLRAFVVIKCAKL